MASAIGFGIYFGYDRPVFDRRRIDGLIRLLVNVFGWAFQGAGALSIVSISISIELWVPVVAVIVVTVLGVVVNYRIIAEWFGVELENV
jgi:hypothetical protein